MDLVASSLHTWKWLFRQICTRGSTQMKNCRECSKCGSPYLRWSRTRFREFPLRLLLLQPYRCQSCRERFYFWPTRPVATT